MGKPLAEGDQWGRGGGCPPLVPPPVPSDPLWMPGGGARFGQPQDLPLPHDLGAGFVPRPQFRPAQKGQLDTHVLFEDDEPAKRQRVMPPPAPLPPNGMMPLTTGNGDPASGCWGKCVGAPPVGKAPEIFVPKMHWGKGKGGEVSNGTHVYPFGCGAPEGQESSMVGTPPPPLLPPGTGPLHLECAAPAFMEGQHFPPPTQSLIPLGPARPVFLAAATANIAPVSQNKQIAMQFVSSDRDTQTKMLGDPNVARAILQTLAASPQHATGRAVPQMVSLLGRTLQSPSAMGAPPSTAPSVPAVTEVRAVPAVPNPPGTPKWTGGITLSRNMGKRLPTVSTLLHGRVQDVEVALRCAAGNHGLLDITHRVPFDEVARRAPGTVLSILPTNAAQQAAFDEYAKYFRSKMRAGVARLDGALALYVLPPCEDVPSLQSSVYSLGPHIPRSNCLLGLIAQATQAMPPALSAQPPPPARPATSTVRTESQVSAPVSKDAVTTGASGNDAPAKDDDAGEGEDTNMSSKELLDLFSNPDLIKLLSEEQTAGNSDAPS